MLLSSWRLVTILFTALSMAASFAHLLEMPAKLRLDGETWAQLLHTLYAPGFGTVGAACEVGAVVAIVALAVLVRRRREAFRWTLFAAALVLSAHAAFWLLVDPVNRTMAATTPDALPPNWPALRDRWEFTHGARAILQIVALAALVRSLLVEIPPRDPVRRAA